MAVHHGIIYTLEVGCMGFCRYVWVLFTPVENKAVIIWRLAGIVNDMIFAYNILMLLVWFFVNIANVFAFVCIYSLYLELNDLTKLQDLARLKVRRNFMIKKWCKMIQNDFDQNSWLHFLTTFFNNAAGPGGCTVLVLTGSVKGSIRNFTII
jgi:hypothetical protein